MSDKHGNIASAVAGIFIFAVVGVLLFGYYKLIQSSQDNQDFKVVCEYQGGHVEGDVCVQGNRIILTQNQWKLNNN